MDTFIPILMFTSSYQQMFQNTASTILICKNMNWCNQNKQTSLKKKSKTK